MTPNKKLRSKGLEAEQLEKVHGGIECRGTQCGSELHCPNCNHVWPPSLGADCPLCAKSTAKWF